jgi:hypothetical protein
MLDLRKASVEEWIASLPSDVRSVMPAASGDDFEGLAALQTEIERTPDSRIADLVSRNGEAFKTMGRARRMRFLAWVARRASPDAGPIIRAVTSEGGDEGDGDGGHGPLFLEDLRAFVEALGPRVARLTFSEGAVEAAVQAAYRLQTEADLVARKGV